MFNCFRFDSSLLTYHFSLITCEAFASRSRLVRSVRRALPLRARGLRAPCASFLIHDTKVVNYRCISKFTPSIYLDFQHEFGEFSIQR